MFWGKDAAAKLRSFYFHVPDYMALCMWKMQILDERHLLIKYGDAEQAGWPFSFLFSPLFLNHNVENYGFFF